MTRQPKRLIISAAVLSCLAHAGHAQITLADSAPNYSTGIALSTAVYNRHFGETSQDADYISDEPAEARWWVNTWKDTSGTTGAGTITRVRTPGASWFSTSKSLKFDTTALNDQQAGISYNLPLQKLKINTRYRIKLRIGTDAGQQLKVDLRSIFTSVIKGVTIFPDAITKTFDLQGGFTDVTFDGVIVRPEGVLDANSGSLRFYPHTAGVPFYVDAFSITEVRANPLNLVEDLPFGKPTSTKPLPLDRRMFGLHINELGSHNAWPDLGQEILRLWGTDGSYWFSLEPTQGDWTHWGVLDYHINHFRKPLPSRPAPASAELIYTLGQTPKWAAASTDLTGCSYKQTTPELFSSVCSAPARLADFRNYVYTVASKYQDKIKYFEIWNEPGAANFFTGSPAGKSNPEWLAELTREAKAALNEVGKGQQLIGPAVYGSWMDRYIKAGAGEHIDIFNFHGYFSPHLVEADLPPLLAQVKLKMMEYGLSTKPLWNTESGTFCGTTGELCTGRPTVQEQFGMLPRALALQWANGVSNADYFFMEGWDTDWNGLVQRPTEKLTLADGTTVINECNQWKYDPTYCTEEMRITPAGAGFATFGKWLKDAKLYSAYKMSSENIYIYKLRTASNVQSYLVWTSDSVSKQVKPPTAWGVKRIHSLDSGDSAGTSYTAGSVITLPPRMPVLLTQ